MMFYENPMAPSGAFINTDEGVMLDLKETS